MNKNEKERRSRSRWMWDVFVQSLRSRFVDSSWAERAFAPRLSLALSPGQKREQDRAIDRRTRFLTSTSVQTRRRSQRPASAPWGRENYPSQFRLSRPTHHTWGGNTQGGAVPFSISQIVWSTVADLASYVFTFIPSTILLIINPLIWIFLACFCDYIWTMSVYAPFHLCWTNMGFVT